jgi:hypothetical protein
MEIKDVNKSYFFSVLKVGAVIGLAYLSAYLLSSYCKNWSDFLITGSRIIGLSLIAGAVLGRVGWAIQSWAGETPIEKHNFKVFQWLYLLGIFFTALSLFM